MQAPHGKSALKNMWRSSPQIESPMRIIPNHALWLSIFLFWVTTPKALACWNEAASRYNVSADLLYAIAKHESSLNSLAINVNKNKTTDIGIMQINSIWLPQLKTFGIMEKHLYNACTNIHVGAWILGSLIHKHGLSWDTVGRYNGGGTINRTNYAWKIYKKLHPTSKSEKPTMGISIAKNEMESSSKSIFANPIILEKIDE